MHLSTEQLDAAARIDAKVQRLMAEGADDIALFVEMSDDMPAFKRLLFFLSPYNVIYFVSFCLFLQVGIDIC
jgi:hypothetical protein